MENKKLVGLDIQDESIALEGQDLVGKVSAVHQGKIGSMKLTIEGKLEFLPLVNKGIDLLEQVIPGDQKAVAEMLKTAVANIKIKF